MTTRTYNVSGMTCAHCVAVVTRELERLQGVGAVDVDLDAGTATITSTASLDAAAVAAAVEAAGYQLVR